MLWILGFVFPSTYKEIQNIPLGYFRRRCILAVNTFSTSLHVKTHTWKSETELSSAATITTCALGWNCTDEIRVALGRSALACWQCFICGKIKLELDRFKGVNVIFFSAWRKNIQWFIYRRKPTDIVLLPTSKSFYYTIIHLHHLSSEGIKLLRSWSPGIQSFPQKTPYLG